MDILPHLFYGGEGDQRCGETFERAMKQPSTKDQLVGSHKGRMTNETNLHEGNGRTDWDVLPIAN